MSPQAIDQLSPLAAELRVNDPDRYLAALFAPPARRESLIALYAFDHELEHMQRIVREPMAGLIRLQWWQDVIDGFEKGGPIAHPVVQGLRRAVMEGGLDAAYLVRAIDGRRKPFEEDLPADLKRFESYLLDIGGSISRAAASLLGADDQETLQAANRIGLVRAAWEQHCYLETSSPERRGWLPSSWLEGGREAIGDGRNATARSHLADWALTQLNEARRLKTSIPRPLLAAFFPGTLAGVWLVDSIHADRRPLLRTAALRLIWCWLRCRY